MDSFMAATADHEGLTPPHGHEVHPCGVLTAAGLVEVGALADMVHLQLPLGFTNLAALGKEPVDPRVAPGAGHDRGDVGTNGRALPSEREPADAGNPRRPAPIARDGDVQARTRP